MGLSCSQFFDRYVNAARITESIATDATCEFLERVGDSVDVECSLAYVNNGETGARWTTRVSAGTFDFIRDRDDVFADLAIGWLTRIASGRTWAPRALWQPERFTPGEPAMLGFGFEDTPGSPLRLKSYYKVREDRDTRITRLTIEGQRSPVSDTYMKTDALSRAEQRFVSRLCDCGLRISDTIRVGNRLLVELAPTGTRDAMNLLHSLDIGSDEMAQLFETLLSDGVFLACLAVDLADDGKLLRVATYFRRYLDHYG
jgi:hypothetical protein